MKRQLIAASAAITLGLLGAVAPASAQSWPTRPITLIVPFAPGGATDIVGRLMGDQLTKALGQSVVVENKAGAGGAIGMTELSRARPDGYTYALITDSIPIQPLVNSALTWDMSHFQAVSKIATSPEVLAVHPDIPASTVQEFVEYAKSRPGDLSYAASSTGSVHHLAGELFKQQTNIDMVHIPYKGGGQSLVDLAAGRVQAAFIGLAPVLPQWQAGQLKVLALTGSQRNELAPDVPTFQEAGYGEFDVELWIGLVAHKDTPDEAVRGMTAAISRILETDSVQKNLRDIGFEPVQQGSLDFPAWLAEQQQGWGKVVDEIGMRAQ